MGAAKLKLYHPNATNAKQLVVEADTKEKMIASFDYCLLEWCWDGWAGRVLRLSLVIRGPGRELSTWYS